METHALRTYKDQAADTSGLLQVPKWERRKREERKRGRESGGKGGKIRQQKINCFFNSLMMRAH